MVIYEMRKYRYRVYDGKRRTRLHWVVYARERSTADVIASLISEAMEPFSLKPCRLSHPERVCVSEPPYDMEQSQIAHFESIIARRKGNAISKEIRDR